MGNSIILFSFSILMLLGCKKDFLDKKPNTNIVIPETLDDMVQLLDEQVVMIYNAPAMGIISADEYFVPSLKELNARPTKVERNCYLWNKDIYGGEQNIPDWNLPFQAIFYSNVVLEQWVKLSANDQSSEKGKYVKAWALFSRSYAFYNLVQIFSPAYDSNKSNFDLGIPLKLTGNINDVPQRSTVEQTYSRIITDLQSSLELYSNSFPTKNRNRPSKAAVNALLGRIFLSMGKYSEALNTAQASLSSYNKLIDFNTLDSTTKSPFTPYHDEMILQSIVNLGYPTTTAVVYGRAAIDTGLIKLYNHNDLRINVFFSNENGRYAMKGGYVGNIGYYPFAGLAVDEVYLIKAECLARKNDLPNALNTLNELLLKRFKSGTYIPFESLSQSDILNRILEERRKELVWRGLRWSDLKRLNAAGANITLVRYLDGQTYILPPNDPRYVMPIPDDEIALSHISQNIR